MSYVLSIYLLLISFLPFLYGNEIPRNRSHALHVGEYFTNPDNLKIFGIMQDSRSNSSRMQSFQHFYEMYRYVNQYTSKAEAFIAMTRYFWGMDGGIVLEIGALDGVRDSESHILHTQFHWHRIIIEASPRFSPKMKTNSPDAFAFGTAVCSVSSTLHYIDVVGGTAGIIEFMNDRYLRKFHKYLVGIPREKWNTVQNVSTIQCLPMKDIIEETRVTHINLFVLDVEGAELSVLKTIDFTAVRFDVIVVETEPAGLRPEGFLTEVVSLLLSFDYERVEAVARNTWFKHKTFQLSARPT